MLRKPGSKNYAYQLLQIIGRMDHFRTFIKKDIPRYLYYFRVSVTIKKHLLINNKD